MSENWGEYAEAWDSNEAVVLYSVKAHESLLSIVEVAGQDILDFGCGTGLLTEKVSRQASSVVAIDPSEKMIAILDEKRLENVHTITNELSQDLIDTNDSLSHGFDLIVASSSLAFVPNYLEMLKLFKQLLRTGGLLIQWDWLKENGADGDGFSSHEIESGLRQARFSEYSTSVPFSMIGEEGSMSIVMGVARN